MGTQIFFRNYKWSKYWIQIVLIWSQLFEYQIIRIIHWNSGIDSTNTNNNQNTYKTLQFLSLLLLLSYWLADVSGGYSEYKGQADVYQYDMENDKWQTVSTLIHPRYSHSVAVVENWSSYLQYCSLNPWCQHKPIF